MARPSFTNPVRGPRIVPSGQERTPEDRLPNGNLGFRVTSTHAQHAESGRAVGTDVGNFVAGDEVVAMAPGTVTFVEPKREGIVRLDHGDGWSSGYAHMDEVTLKVGAKVARGAVLGKVGKRGTTQVHLHFDIGHNGVKLDAWPLLEQNAITEEFAPLATLVVKGGTNLRKEPTTGARAHYIATDSAFDLLGVKTDGGWWEVAGESGFSWYRIRRESDWWVYTAGAKSVALTKWGLALVPPQPPADCSAYQNRIERARVALEGFANPHHAEEVAVSAALAMLKEA